MIFLKGSGQSHNFFPRFYDGIGIVLLGEDVLVEGTDRGEGFP